jgi:two-component system CheB/CheR fusion protein
MRVAVIGGQQPDSISQIVRGIPAGSGFAMIIAGSEDPDLANLLRPLSATPVIEVREATRIERDHVYVVPSGTGVVVQDGTLVVDHHAPSRTLLDRLLRSVADAHGRDSAAVLLAGSGTDGTLGIKRLKEVGGLTIVQTPDGSSDGESELPRIAIATGMVDLVLGVPEIPGRLFALGREIIEPEIVEPDVRRADVTETLRDILTLVRIRTGHDFGPYKRATLLRRLSRRMQVCQTSTIAEYHKYVRDHPGEISSLLRDFLISVTNFFREPEAFAALATNVIPKLFHGKGAGDQVRVWVVGCATGEEAYSIAILLLEQARRMTSAPQLQVFATDIDEDALDEARAGRYPESICVDVDSERLGRFFEREAGYYRVCRELRELVLFSPHNALRDPPFSRLDLVSCRNMLIYLNRDAQDRVFGMFHFALRSDGFLFLGSSEPAENTLLFATVAPKHRLFARRMAPSSYGFDAVPSTSRRISPHAVPPALPAERTVSFGEMHHRLVEHYAPPSVLVSEELEVLHVSEHAGQFLQIAGGEPTRQLLRLAHPALRLDLRTAIYAARQHRANESRMVRFDDNGTARAIMLRVRMVDVPELAGSYLVLFDEQQPAPEPLAESHSDAFIEPVVREIEDELNRTRDQLRTTIEQYETSVEELKASNEELQAINEELRSATEELETSKEELQSVNEELTTLNQELKGKVEELSRANSDLQNLMQSTDIGVVFLDRFLNIKRYTPRVTDLINIIPSDLNRPLAHLTHRLDTNELPELARRVLRDLRTVERDVRTSDDRRFLARLLPYRSLEDRIDGVVLTFVEVSDLRAAIDARRRSEDKLEAVEKRLRVALRDAPMVVFGIDRNRKLTWGYAQGKELRAGAPEVFEMFAAGHADRFASIIREVLDTYAGRRVELDLIIEGELRTYDFRIDPGADQVTAVGFDITPSKLAQASLLEADRRKDEFLATLSHELRNPLTPLKVALDVAKLAAGDPEQLEQSRAIMERQVTVLGQLVDELLDLSRITQGKIELDLVPLEPVTIVEAALELTRPLLQQHGHELRVQLPRVPCRVLGDRQRLVQVLSNLLTNAVKYTPDKGHISVELETDLVRQLLVTRVRDDGVGIPPDMLPRIFDIFVQCRDALGRSQGGLGIGLNLVRRLVELHGGRVSASSMGESKGSEFVVELPIVVK